MKHQHQHTCPYCRPGADRWTHDDEGCDMEKHKVCPFCIVFSVKIMLIRLSEIWNNIEKKEKICDSN